MSKTMEAFEAISKLVNPDIYAEMLEKVRQ